MDRFRTPSNVTTPPLVKGTVDSHRKPMVMPNMYAVVVVTGAHRNNTITTARSRYSDVSNLGLDMRPPSQPAVYVPKILNRPINASTVVPTVAGRSEEHT